MSDQTEWTVTDFGLVRLNGKDMVTALTYDQGKALVDAIKVALTAEREKVKALVDALEKVLSETVDARDYLDGPCLDASTRIEIKDALAKVKGD